MTPTNEKRVKCLYRVSTNKQLDDNEIPMQKTACQKILDQHPDWHLVDEYLERGISGYKTSIKNRDEVQKALRDAVNGDYDVLLLFASDRLCRIQDDYTPILRQLSKYVEVWTFTQGDITIRTHTDALKASIDGWQNEGESIKISLRTDEKHKQMSADGEFRGGSNPYGYKFIKTGKYSKRDTKQRKELFDLIIDETEGEVVKTIFNLAYEFKYGGNRIATYLNEQAVLTRNNKKWAMQTINYMLRNPIYKGYPAYGKKTCKDGQIRQHEDVWILSKDRIEKLAIIPEDVWNTVNLIRKERKFSNSIQDNPTPTKSKLLFVGIIKCGHCGSPLVTTHNTRNWIKKDGTQKKVTHLKYRCSGKQSGKVKCDGKSIHAQDKIEEPVLQFVEDFLNQIETYNFSSEFDKDKKESTKLLSSTLENLNKSKEEKYREIEVLQDEIPKTIMGTSPFTKEQCSNLIKKRTLELEEIRNKCLNIEVKIKEKEKETLDINAFKSIAPNWKDIFYGMTVEKQKITLSHIIDNIFIYNDRYEINIKMHIQEFVNSITGMQNTKKWESKYEQTACINIIEKLLIINLDELRKVS